MSIERVFLDWRRPAVPAAAEYLAARAEPGTTLDLREFIVALPGARASRRLLELLVETAEAAGRGLLPPKMVTVGRLPELLYEAKFPFAEDFTQHLAWVRVLRSLPRERLTPFIRQLPDPDDLAGWLPLGEMLAALHRELAADRLNFADVLAHGRRIPGFDETARWELMVEIRDEYLRLLDSLKLWDRQTARLVAIERGECRTEKQIVLVGAVDLNQTLRAMLDQVTAQSDADDTVTALVFAPAELADRFDEHGCLVPEAWQEAVVDGVFERAEVVDGPADQAAAAARALAAFGGRYAAEDIVIGVPDQNLVPWITQALEECGLPVRYGVGTEIPQTSPGRLLRSVAEFVERRTYAALSALVRHPDLEPLLKAAGAGDDWLTAFDAYYCQYLPFGVPDVAAEDFNGPGELQAACREVLRLTDPLSGPSRTPAEWAAAIVTLLLDVYAGRDLDQSDQRDRAIVVACEQIRAAVDLYTKIPAELAPRISGAEAILRVLEAVASDTVPPMAATAAIELVGWLELPLDDAPALVITGFNEGSVPSSLNADAFLPNELRRHLRLNDNARRYARDAYALSVLAQSRRELKLIAGRRTADGDPLIPSRLLFACRDEELPHRVLRLLRPPAARARPVFAGSLVAGRERSAFDVPRPTPVENPVVSMRVTEFRDYLKCPYRYYLKRQLRLEAVETSAEELDGAAFGNLIHDVLQWFGECDEVKSSTRPEEIVAFFDDALDRAARSLRRTTPLPAIGVQLEQARLRLKTFAEWQARRAAEGWRIVRTELDVREDDGVLLVVDGVPLTLRGRIDRIDIREGSHGLEVVLFDYKTGDRGTTPDQTHRKQHEWVDLQLPLYRHLIRVLNEPAVDGPVQLGYILLPRDLRAVGSSLANWTPADLTEADRVAEWVVREIRKQVFWPRKMELFGDEFAAICQEELLVAAADAEGETPGMESEQ